MGGRIGINTIRFKTGGRGDGKYRSYTGLLKANLPPVQDTYFWILPRLSSYVYAVFTSLQIENKEVQFQTKEEESKRNPCAFCAPTARPPGSSARSGCGARLGSGLGARGGENPSRSSGARSQGLAATRTGPPNPGPGALAAARVEAPRAAAGRSAALREAEWARPWRPHPTSGRRPGAPLWPEGLGARYRRPAS